jgi:hypothetical protein
MVLKFSHQINAAPWSWRAAKLALRSSEQGKVNTELGLNGPDPRISSQWLLGLLKSRGLHGIKVLILGDSRLAIHILPTGIVL